MEIKRDSTGKVVRKHREIDFVANLGSRKYYIQSAFLLSGEEKERQEKKSLTTIDDSFKKIIITRDYVKESCGEDGILTLGIMDFLLNENSLDL